MKMLAVSILIVAAIAVVGGLYASGPKHKAADCKIDPGLSRFDRGQEEMACERQPEQRTNAWERVKGAITGNP